jgi:hypothetical protein
VEALVEAVVEAVAVSVEIVAVSVEVVVRSCIFLNITYTDKKQF